MKVQTVWQWVLVTVAFYSCLVGVSRADDPPLFVEEDGVVIGEVEAVEPAGLWKPGTDLNGFTGRCYYTWTGKGINRSGRAGQLIYTIRITTPGTYQLRIHNRHDFHDSTEENDCFTQMDEGKPTKTFSSRRGEWTWRSNHEHDHHTKPPASYQLSAGDHTFVIAGRSGGFSIDRFVFYRDGKEKEATDLSRTPTTGLPDLPKLEHLSRVLDDVEDRKLGYALRTAERELDDKNEAKAAEAKLVVDRLTEYAEARKTALQELKKAQPLAALEGTERLADLYRGCDLAGDLKDMAREWSREPEMKQAREANELYDKINKYVSQIRESRVSRDHPSYDKHFDKEFRRIERYLETLEERYPDAPACQRARELAKGVLPADR